MDPHFVLRPANACKAEHDTHSVLCAHAHAAKMSLRPDLCGLHARTCASARVQAKVCTCEKDEFSSFEI